MICWRKTGTSQNYINKNDNLNTFTFIFPSKTKIRCIKGQRTPGGKRFGCNYRGTKVKVLEMKQVTSLCGKIPKKIGPIFVTKKQILIINIKNKSKLIEQKKKRVKGIAINKKIKKNYIFFAIKNTKHENILMKQLKKAQQPQFVQRIVNMQQNIPIIKTKT